MNLRGIAILGVLGAAVAWSPVAVAYNPTSTPEAAQQASSTLAKLERPLTVKFDENRLEDVIKFIEQAAAVTSFDVRYMEEGGAAAGLDRDAKVTLEVTNLPALQIIERVLAKVSDEFDPATWQISTHGEFVMGPKSRLNADKRLRVYDIQDLVFAVPSFTDVPQLDVSSVLNQSSGRGGGGGGGNIFNTTNTGEGEAESQDELVRKVIDIIETSIEREQWQSNGGDGAVVAVYQGSTLLITAPDYIHRQLEGYSFK